MHTESIYADSGVEIASLLLQQSYDDLSHAEMVENKRGYQKHYDIALIRKPLTRSIFVRRHQNRANRFSALPVLLLHHTPEKYLPLLVSFFAIPGNRLNRIGFIGLIS
ncbi:MAG: hypothetical protein CVV06_16490 [Gammaproteobacteria bacterium HGW-Gammaproteobacteria-10]|nr:MAG: hypothetical protein CVV06_16490 [Gammaproteobacteria bacterium HGW-Gammaproteobacteria-10]